MDSSVGGVHDIAVLRCFCSKGMVYTVTKIVVPILGLQTLRYGLKIKCPARCEGQHVLINKRKTIESLTRMVLNFGHENGILGT